MGVFVRDGVFFGGGGGGSASSHLIIFSDSGSTVVVTKPDGTSTITPELVSTGRWECDVDEYGTYTVSATLSSSTKTATVDVDTATEYTINLPQSGVITVDVAQKSIELTYAQYQALEQAGEVDSSVAYFCPDLNVAGAVIDDTTTASNKVWSSTKVSTELSGKASATALINSNKVSTFEVSTSSWSADTTSQSGITLYKKSISLSHVYTDSMGADIGCGSGSVLPTNAEQEAYNLLQYVTCDDTVPCLYLYASAIPETAFYIKVKGVD